MTSVSWITPWDVEITTATGSLRVTVTLDANEVEYMLRARTLAEDELLGQRARSECMCAYRPAYGNSTERVMNPTCPSHSRLARDLAYKRARLDPASRWNVVRIDRRMYNETVVHGDMGYQNAVDTAAALNARNSVAFDGRHEARLVEDW